jgi:hypothetical protein
MWSASSTAVDKVRLRKAQVDPSVARLRLSHLLSSVLLQPPAMPPSAVLVVRSMQDPLPGRIAKEFASTAAPSAEWESAARSQLGALYARAARPAAGPVPPSAEAVLFADYGELLACLALDFSATPANSWWWKSALRHFSSRLSRDWVEVWAEHPVYVPSALQHLGEQGEAAAVLERITAAQAWRLLHAVVCAFGLSESDLAVNPMMQSQPPLGESQAPASIVTAAPTPTEHHDQQKPNSEHTGGALHPPWEFYVEASSIPVQLGVARRALLGISLLLRRAPRVASSAAFALRLRSWLVAERERENRPADGDASSSAAQALPAIWVQPQVEDKKVSESPVRVSDSRPVEPAAETTVADASPLVSREKSSPPVSDPKSGGELPLLPATRSSADPTAENAREQSQLQLANGCRTSLGGILYLIHFLRQSQLLGFETGLGGWALLELLARCLLGRAFTVVADDPIWTALTLLDGRAPGAPAGDGFHPQLVYEAPDSWGLGLASPTHYVRFRSTRMEIWHPEGFLLLDSQDHAHLAKFSPLTRLTRQQQRIRRDVAQVSPVDLPLSPELRRFLHFILPYARWRLHAALQEMSLPEALLRAGTLYISRTHIDLVMGMPQISVPVRIAGLDANPGWIPELGRVITFHFVQEGFGYD